MIAVQVRWSILQAQKTKQKKSPVLSSIKANIFGKAALANDLSTEIDQYISEANEKSTTNVLTYWSQHAKIYPSLSLMAKSYLGIPAKENLYK